jgi:NADH:ubiquinone oxidoreductase subunit K
MDAAVLAVMVYLAATVSAAAGIYGVLASRSLLKLLVSIEILFNSVVLSAAYIGAVSRAGPGFYSLLLATIVLTIAEIAIVAAILVLVYRRRRSLSTDLLRELKG